MSEIYQLTHKTLYIKETHMISIKTTHIKTKNKKKVIITTEAQNHTKLKEKP